MMIFRAIAALAVVLLFAPDPAAAQSWERYQPTTFGAVVAAENQALSDAPDDTTMAARAYGPGPAIRATLSFVGSTRPIASETREFIGKWFVTRGWDAGEAEVFTEEWLFREDDTDYWVAVQAETAASMRGGVRAGDAVTLYAVLIGAHKARGIAAWQWVFILSAAASG